MKPEVSVIIPTRGRNECLRRTLESLSQQRFQEFDVWVMDQNLEPLPNLKQSIPNTTLHHISMPPLGSHAGRNQAIFETDSKVCIFVDDDVLLPKDFIEKHVLAYQKNFPPISAVAGRVIQPKDQLSEEEMYRRGKPARYNRWLGRVTGNFFGSQSCFVDHIHECNFSASTQALRRVGGFNEEFQGNAYFEGADLSLRLIRSNHKILYCPEITLIHLQEDFGGNRVTDKAQHTYWYLRNYGLLNSLHMHKIGISAYLLHASAYIFGKSLLHTSPQITFNGLRGLVDGLQYFLPNKTRLKTRTYILKS